jgi:hypothetical protein
MERWKSKHPGQTSIIERPRGIGSINNPSSTPSTSTSSGHSPRALVFPPRQEQDQLRYEKRYKPPPPDSKYGRTHQLVLQLRDVGGRIKAAQAGKRDIKDLLAGSLAVWKHIRDKKDNEEVRDRMGDWEVDLIKSLSLDDSQDGDKVPEAPTNAIPTTSSIGMELDEEASGSCATEDDGDDSVYSYWDET